MAYASEMTKEGDEYGREIFKETELKIIFLRILNSKIHKKKICFSIHIGASLSLFHRLASDDDEKETRTERGLLIIP